MSSGDRTSSAGLAHQFRSFGRVFWTANIIEMFERLAYYGLRTVVPIYMVLAIEDGGPQFDHMQKGFIFAWWAAIQSFVPIFTGGFADRFGYKLTVGISIGIKVAGYLVMAFALEIAAALTGGASTGVPGHTATLYSFCAGAWLLALGTAIFKPGIQGILAHQLNEDNDSTGWAVFYQLVNLGAWFGPFLAGYLRLLDWKYVFVACAIIVSVNYLFLLTFSEPEQDVAVEENKRFTLAAGGKVLWQSAIGICEPRLMAFLVVFSGFWFMFNQLFDMLPNFIDQWVDSSGALALVTSALNFDAPADWGGNLPQEYMINLNAGMIMIMAFAVGFVTGKVRSMTAMIVGMGITSASMYLLGVSPNGWMVLGAIALFSIGEMASSPTKMRYFSSIAPPGKKGLYLGYINATNGFGWSVGSLIAGELYQERGDIFVLGRKHLVEQVGMAADAVEKLPQTEVLGVLAEKTGMTQPAVQQLLWDTYSPQQIWPYFAQIGVASMVGILLFDQITRRKLAAETPLLVALTFCIASFSYGFFWATCFTAPMLVYIAVQQAAPQLLPQGQSQPDEQDSSAA